MRHFLNQTANFTPTFSYEHLFKDLQAQFTCLNFCTNIYLDLQSNSEGLTHSCA